MRIQLRHRSIHILSTEQRANILTVSRKEKFCYFPNLIGMFDVEIGKEIKGENVGKLISPVKQLHGTGAARS